MDKIGRLKKKHQKNATRGKNDDDLKLMKLHDKKIKLSKKIWGFEGTIRNGKASNIEKGGNNKNVATPQAQLTSSLYSKGV